MNYYVIGLLVSALVLMAGALIAVVYTWRKDIRTLLITSESKLQIENRCTKLEMNAYELKSRNISLARALEEEIAKASLRDMGIADNGNPTAVVDALKQRLQEDHTSGVTQIGITPTKVQPANVSKTYRDKPET